MITDLDAQIKKMLNDYSVLNKSKNELFEKTMQDINKIEDKEAAAFLSQSIKDAKNGKLDIAGFIKSSEKFKTL